jgi:NAD(P)-dependent dehydrogenase (short-subunit alcohol dehydrogenase family)
LDAAAAEIGRNVTGVQGDVANLNDLDRLYEAVKSRYRQIDVIFANAGVSQIATLGTVDGTFFDLHFDANVKGLFFTVQKGLLLMNDGGTIILNACIATIKGFPGIIIAFTAPRKQPSGHSRAPGQTNSASAAFA